MAEQNPEQVGAYLDACMERQDHRTPAGGVYSVAHFQDENGRPVPKAEAVLVRILEYDAQDSCIHTTLARVRPETVKAKPGI